jgi:hypothetical protein
MMKNDSTPVFFVLLVGLACVLVWLVARRVMEWRRRKQIVDDQRTRMMGQPVPPDIQRDTVRAKSGDFEGEELSPLSYLGYRVGKTNGLRPDARRKRLKICFAIEMPSLLPSKYRRWGRPVANQRRGRPNYEFAVSDWEADAKWMESEFGQMVRDLKRYGFRR